MSRSPAQSLRSAPAALALAVTAALSSRAALGQAISLTPDDGPVIVGQLPEYDKVFFDRPSAELELSAAFQRDSQSSPTSSNESEQIVFLQSLSLDTTGYILHPNFLSIDAGLTFGVTESFVDVNGNSSSEYAGLYEWDLRTTFLRNGSAPLSAHSRRQQEWIFREFGPAIESTVTDTGIAVDFRGLVPTHLAYSHLESEQSDAAGVPDFAYTRDAFAWLSTAVPSSNQRIIWNYNFASIDQSGSFSSYQTHDATLTHEYRFGRRGRSSLRSMLDYSLQDGVFDNQTFRWDERLLLRHNDDLLTRYAYTLSHFTVGGNSRIQHRGSAGFTHKLYDSLTTNGSIGAQQTRNEDASGTQETFADLTFDYRKRVPLGTLYANFGGSWNNATSDTQTEPIQIVNQPANFADPQPIVIPGTNVDPNSIVITDPSGLLLFQPGTDYSVSVFPDRVEIDRVIGGLIAPNSPVLLNYILHPLPASRSSQQVLRTGLRYEIQEGPLNGLGLFARYLVSSQSIDTEVPSAFVPNDFADTVFGGDYTVGGLVVGLEHQKHDSDVNPFDANRAYTRYNFALDSSTVLQLAASYSVIDYEMPENQVKLFTTSARITQAMSQNLFWAATALYRNETDDRRGDVEGIEAQFDLTWRYRQTEAYLRLRAADLQSNSTDQSSQFIQIGIRREF